MSSEQTPLLQAERDVSFPAGEGSGSDLDSNTRVTTCSNRGVRIALLCLSTMTFLQFIGTDLDHGLRIPAVRFFNLTADESHTFLRRFKSLVAGFALLLYFLPIVVGLYADAYVGRYRTLCLGIGLKLIGGVLCFIITLVYETTAMEGTDKILVRGILLFIFMFGFTFVVIGCFPMVTVGTFAAQQGEQTFYGISSALRWFLFAGILGMCLRELVGHLYNLESSTLGSFQLGWYYPTVLFGIQLGCDFLTAALLLLPNIYRRKSTEQGSRSLKDLIRIIRTHIFCSKPLEPEDDDVFQSLVSRQRAQSYRRTLDRMKIRKAVLFMGLMACFALAISMTFFMTEIFTTLKHHWSGYYPFKIVKQTMYIPYLVGAPVMDLIYRKFGQKLRPDTIVAQFRIIAVASAVGSIALIIGGAVIILERVYGFGVVTEFWLIPQFIAMGTAGFLLFSSVLTLCYLVSPPGLETFIGTINICLSVLIIAIGAFISIGIDLKKFVHLEVVCFALAGVMLLSLLIIYLPVCRWYLKTDADIEEFIEAEDRGENMAVTCEFVRDSTVQNPDVVEPEVGHGQAGLDEND